MKEPDYKTIAVKSDPQMIDVIIKHVANGGSVIDLAKSWGVNYSEVMSAIRKNPEWKESYAHALEDRTEWAKEAVLREISSLALLDAASLYDESGGLLPISQWPAGARGAVISIESIEQRLGGEVVGEIKKVKTESKLKALELLGRTQALFSDKITHSADDSLSSVLAQTVARGPKA